MADDPAPAERGGIFPATRASMIERARSDDPQERRRALDAILSVYWKPVYKYVRARWSRSVEDAQDLTQEFFTALVDRGTLDAYDPARARLRTFLRSCVDALVANRDRDARRLKRGGDAIPLSLDAETAEGELLRTGIVAPDRSEDFFEKEWIRSLFATAVDRLREECAARGKQVHFTIFARYDLDDSDGARPSYADLAQELGIKVTDVTNHLAFARRELRRIVLDVLRATTASEEEFRREARSLLGHDPA